MTACVRCVTLVRLREQPYEAGTVFAVVETPDVAATDPVQVDAGTADRWLRFGQAEAAAGAPARKART